MHTTGRLILIKKKPLEIPNENNLRPIVIGSVMIKILETIMLNNAQQTLLKSYSKFQLGFIPEKGCEMHLLRLINFLKFK